MTRIPTLLTLVAAAALAGCNSENHNIVAGGPEPDQAQTNVAANANVQLPPSIAASKSYRCKDNKVVYVDWMSDGTAHVKLSRDAVGTPVPPGSNELTGSASSASITYKGESCKA
jgi:hypothetical protein